MKKLKLVAMAAGLSAILAMASPALAATTKNNSGKTDGKKPTKTVAEAFWRNGFDRDDFRFGDRDFGFRRFDWDDVQPFNWGWNNWGWNNGWNNCGTCNGGWW